MRRSLLNDRSRRRAVSTEMLVMMDAVDGKEVGTIVVDQGFRQRFSNPYAVIHRADIHGAILDGVRNSPLIVLLTSARVEDMVQDGAGVTVTDSQGRRHTADALIGCDGVKPVIRDKLIGDAVRVSGHVVYRAVVPGDAAYPMLQYLAQGACMAIEDAVTLAAALERTDCDFDAAFSLYQQTRIPRIARVVLSAREMGRLYHAKGVERLVRSSLWKGRSNAGFYDALEWLYGWKPETCLDA